MNNMFMLGAVALWKSLVLHKQAKISDVFVF